jgi:Leucine-rich repeat (LRR) protein
VEILNLSETRLASFPHFALGCKKLATLILSKTEIKQLPDGIGNARNLKHLDISKTKVKSIPGNTIELLTWSLEKLDIPA